MIFLKNKTKLLLVFSWLSVLTISLCVYFYDSSIITSNFIRIFSSSEILGYFVFLIASCLRGFTLIPVTYFILGGIIFFPPWPLYIITIFGVVVSSLCVYYFSEYLNFDKYFETNYKKQVDRIRSVLSKNEFPIVVTWSFMPFLPTDLMCYVCGTLDVNVKKFILGVALGEGITCAIYIFLGKEILNIIMF